MFIAPSMFNHCSIDVYSLLHRCLFNFLALTLINLFLLLVSDVSEVLVSFHEILLNDSDGLNLLVHIKLLLYLFARLSTSLQYPDRCLDSPFIHIQQFALLLQIDYLELGLAIGGVIVLRLQFLNHGFGIALIEGFDNLQIVVQHEQLKVYARREGHKQFVEILPSIEVHQKQSQKGNQLQVEMAPLEPELPADLRVLHDLLVTLLERQALPSHIRVQHDLTWRPQFIKLHLQPEGHRIVQVICISEAIPNQ